MGAPVARGFFGKLPSRGDFLRAGLPRSYTDPWDAWLQTCLPESRAALGEDWVTAWFEAPVWRFALAPGVCGPDAVLGLWVPSVDRVGRDFPLTVAALSRDMPSLASAHGAWLDVAEAAACDAVTAALDPEILARALAVETPPAEADIPDPVGGSVWWTQGAPRVPPMQLATAGLPSRTTFTTMLSAAEETA